MDPRDKQAIIERYDARLAEYGADMRALASGTDERRAMRYEVLRQVGISGGDRVLDVGCGFGTFSEHLWKQGVEADYTGCDINPALIEIAQRQYPAGRFLVLDIQTDAVDRRYDYVVSSSALNNKLENVDNYAHARDFMAHAYELADKGVAIDFMSSYVDFRSDVAFHYEPERIFAFAKGLSKRVCLRHDYPLFEFCIYIYKDFAGWGRR